MASCSHGANYRRCREEFSARTGILEKSCQGRCAVDENAAYDVLSVEATPPPNLGGDMLHENEDWSDEESRPETVLNLSTVQKMLPYVRRVIADIQRRHREIDRLNPQEEGLARKRRELSWQQRKQRYAVQDEISLQDQGMRDALDELAMLDVVLLDPVEGRVGFPTLVNNRPAYFTWQPKEDGLHSWQFVEEDVCRPIPQAWLKEITFSGKQAD